MASCAAIDNRRACRFPIGTQLAKLPHKRALILAVTALVPGVAPLPTLDLPKQDRRTNCQSNENRPGGYVNQLRECHRTEIDPGENVLPEECELLGEKHGSQHHPGNTKQGVGFPFGGSGHARSRAIAKKHHSHTEDQAAQRHRHQLRRLDMQRCESERPQCVYANSDDQDSRQHRLQDCEVAQQELPYDDRVLGHVTLLQKESEQKPGDQAERRSEEHTSELQSLTNLVCRLLLEKNT